MKREQMIQALIDNDFSDIFNLGETEGAILESILKFGFKGYENFTELELIQECAERDLIYIDDEDEEEYCEI